VTLGSFRGWFKTSLSEYPGRVSTVLFTGGCNLRCPFCYNPELLRSPAELPLYEAEEVLSWIGARKDLVSAVVVTGGEPTLHAWLGEFLAAVRHLGMATALATNGTAPGVIVQPFRPLVLRSGIARRVVENLCDAQISLAQGTPGRCVLAASMSGSPSISGPRG